MGKVGAFLVAHLLARPHYRVHFWPWSNDFMQDYWEESINRIVISSPEGLGIEQSIAFCSVVNAGDEHWAPQSTVWLYYELNTVPPEVVDAINSNDHVYVTSSFVQRIFAEHGVVAPMTVLGNGFDPQHYPYVQRTRGKEFVFLCIAEHTSRKNLPVLVQCFERAFEQVQDVRLVLKLGLHRGEDIRRHITRPDKVTVRTGLLLKEHDVAALYGQAHCFVLPTRAESFGMPILEALATRSPVIVTNYSGHLDFCTEANAYLINTRGWVDSDPECFPHIQRQWADPDPEHLIHLLRHVYYNYDEALTKGQAGHRTAHADWTWDKQLARVFP